MTGRDAAKQLALASVILLVLGCGIMLLPVEATYLRAGYSFIAGLALVAYLIIAKPRAEWLRWTLVTLASGFAIIAFIKIVGG